MTWHRIGGDKFLSDDAAIVYNRGRFYPKGCGAEGMLVDNSDCANNRGLDKLVHTSAHAAVYAASTPCLVASSGAQIQQEQQQQQQEQQQQVRLAQHFLVRSEQRGKT